MESHRWFSVPVEYRHPSAAELLRIFEDMHASLQKWPIKFLPLEAYRDISRETRVIDFELLKLDSEGLNTESLIKAIDILGFRPALYEELIAFATRFPDEQRKRVIYALGSYRREYGARCPPYLNFQGGQGRYLGWSWGEHYSRSSVCYLVTRKQPISPMLPYPEEGDYDGLLQVTMAFTVLPEFDTLKKQFRDCVSGMYARPWERHGSCEQIDDTLIERTFRLARTPTKFLGQTIESSRDDLAARFGQEGFRFATEVEAVAFAAAYPRAQYNHVILALGSSMLDEQGHRYVTRMDHLGGCRFLREHWVGLGLGDVSRLLLVRK
jgi:hypothetical protein